MGLFERGALYRIHGISLRTTQSDTFMGKNDQNAFLFCFHSHYANSDLVDKSLKSHRTLDNSALFCNLSKTLFVKKKRDIFKYIYELLLLTIYCILSTS